MKATAQRTTRTKVAIKRELEAAAKALRRAEMEARYAASTATGTEAAAGMEGYAQGLRVAAAALDRRAARAVR